MGNWKFLKMFVCSALTAILVTGSALAFTDTEQHWASDAITKWSEEYSIIQGYDDGTFRPDNSITRGAFAGILDRFLKFQNVSPAETFSDTAGTYWEEAILKLHASGVYLGNGGKALPGDSITRQQAVTMIARAFEIVPGEDQYLFADDYLMANYARAYVSEMALRGYIRDTTDECFRPTDPITRAEFLSILNHMVELLVPSAEPVSLQEVYGSVLINSSEGATLENVWIAGDLILAPGVQGEVTLCEVDLLGDIMNFSDVEPIILEPEEPEFPEDDPAEEEVEEALKPEDIYTPGQPSGEYLMYNGTRIPIYKERSALQLYEGDFYWEDDRLVYLGDTFTTRFGIDVSAYQNRASDNETIDWEAVAADGVEFVMVRIGRRGTSEGVIYVDEYYEENIRGAMAAGIETGVYFFSQAITIEEAVEEAEFILDLLKDLEIDGPIAYDWEMQDASYRVHGTEPEMVTACAVAFCERIEAAGYTPMVYASQYVSYIKYDQSAIAPYLFWYPEYKGEKSEKLIPTIYYQMDYWQYSSSCTVDGIGGKVDANIQLIW